MDSVARAANGANFEDVIRIEKEKIRSHLGEVVREMVEQTLNGLLQAEADYLCGAKRDARSPDRLDTRAGHRDRKLQTQAGEVSLLRDELLNRELFLSLEEARCLIDRWRVDHNHHRPHSALSYQTLVVFAPGCVLPASATPQPPDNSRFLNLDSLTHRPSQCPRGDKSWSCYRKQGR